MWTLFLLAKWLDKHHSLLAKDYVIVKLIPDLQPGADKINQEIGGAERGIPWFVIAEPDGTILITSESLAGNIGMPMKIEEIRHFRKMVEKTASHLTAEEIDQLVQSLLPRDSTAN